MIKLSQFSKWVEFMANNKGRTVEMTNEEHRSVLNMTLALREKPQNGEGETRISDVQDVSVVEQDGKVGFLFKFSNKNVRTEDIDFGGEGFVPCPCTSTDEISYVLEFGILSVVFDHMKKLLNVDDPVINLEDAMRAWTEEQNKKKEEES